MPVTAAGVTARRRWVAFLVGASMGLPGVALAHGGPVDIAFYGPFTPGAGRCLRVVSAAADRCVMRVLTLQRNCVAAQLLGRPCDQAAVAQAIDAAKQAAQNVVFQTCSDGQLNELLLIGVGDAQADLLKACHQAETLNATLYAPLAASADAGRPLTACVMRTAVMSAKFVRYVLRLRNGALARMGVELLTPSRKNALLNRAASRIGLAWQRVLADLQQACPDFAATYGQSLAGFEATLEANTNCVLGSTYVQTAFVCQ